MSVSPRSTEVASKAACVALGIALLVTVNCSENQAPISGAEAMRMLASIEELRPIVPRLTGLTGYAQCRDAIGSLVHGSLSENNCSKVHSSNSDTIKVLLRLGLAVERPPLEASPDFDHAAGIWFLIHSEEPHAIDRALRHLLAALQKRPENAFLLNDLAAAHLVRAGLEQRPTDLILALNSLEHALSLKPKLAEAKFNKLVVLERLGFCAPAEATWRSYLDLDRSSEWAREAWKRRISMDCDWPEWSEIATWAAGRDKLPPAALERILTLSPADLTRRTLEDLFPAWAKAYLTSDLPQANQRLLRLRHLGAELKVRTGDETIWRSIKEIEGATPSGCRKLAFAHLSFSEGAKLQASSLYTKAQESYLQVSRLSGKPTPPVTLWAQYGVFSTYVTEANYLEAQKIASQLRGSAVLGRYPMLSARLYWSEGLIQLRTGDFADSRQSFDVSAGLFAKSGDLLQRGAARALVAESLHALGLEEEAWRARVEAFCALGRRPSGPLHNLLIDTTLASREEGNGYAAVFFQTAGLDGARMMSSVSRTVEALLWRSKALASLDRVDEALTDLRVALDRAPAIADPGIRSRLTADIQESYGELLLTRDPVMAIRALDKAIAVYRKIDYAWKLPSVILLRAKARLRQGQVALAEVDLEDAIREFERRDRMMPPEIYRYNHFERAQETFDEMMRLQLAQHRPDRALAYLERARRASWDRVARSAEAEPAKTVEALIRNSVKMLPRDVTLVEFAILDDHLLTWVFNKGGIRFIDLPLATLPEEVEGFWSALSAKSWPQEDLEKRAEALYSKLVAPWISEIPAGNYLVFAPDRFLYRLAFAALRDPKRRRWLAEDFVVSTTPSLAFALAGNRATRGQRGGASTLLIGDPRFDPSEAGSLSALPSAADEIEEIATIYPGATVLTSAEARKDSVMDALSNADIVHYAGHASANPRNPWVSFLLLAPSAKGGSGLLLASEIHNLPRRPRRLVVLSACGSGSDGALRSAGFPPLVSAFLELGTEAVISGLWTVNDRAVTALSVELHRGLHRGLPVAEALHRAQLHLIEASPVVSPHLWASLQMAGLAKHNNHSEE